VVPIRDLKFNFENSLISIDELADTLEKLKHENINLKNASLKGYDDDRASINLAFDKDQLNVVKKLIIEKKKLKPKYLIVVGIGGSNLGTIAVQEAIFGKLHNQLEPEIKILFADTVDSDSINDIIRIVEPVLKHDQNIIINGVSKSGGTTETIANFEILVNLLKKYKTDYEKFIVVTTDKNSKFWDLSMKIGFDVLEIPKKVGGRFSVFSSVGLFPLGLIGIDLDELLYGAQLVRNRCLDDNFMDNPAALSACLIYHQYKKKKNIFDLFLFSPDLESFGKWYRQLMGESIGKEYNKNGQKVFNGITPTVSIGSIDLHSMAQLYLGGPFDKFTCFIRVKQNNESVFVPDLNEYSNLVEGIQNIKLDQIMNAILDGVQTAFKKGRRPFIEITLPDKSAFVIGQLLQLKMVAMMYLGYLMDVNPFDQPNVESYKIETKKILEGI
jgi:glucose-6-phosphate isomerase